MIRVNVRDEGIIQFLAPRGLHLPENVGGDLFPRPHIRIGLLCAGDSK